MRTEVSIRERLISLVLVSFTLLQAAAQPAVEVTQEPPALIANPARDLVVGEVIASNPTTIKERLEAVELLLNVGEFKLANEHLTAALTAKSDDAALADLQTELGSDFFVRLLRITEVRDVGTKLVRRVFDASDRVANDPKNIADQIQGAMSDDVDERRVSRGRLIQIGPPAVPGLLIQLAKFNSPVSVGPRANDGGEQPDLEEWATRTKRLRKVIVEMGEPAVPVLIGALHSDQQGWVQNAMQILDHMKSPAARPHLTSMMWHSQLGEEEAQFIRNSIDSLLCSPEAKDPDELDVLPVWVYDKEKEQLIRRSMTTTEHASYSAHLLARRLFLGQPDSEVHRQLAIGTLIGWTKLDRGLDSELPKDFGVQLRDWLAGNQPLTAKDLDLALLTGCRSRQLPAAIGAAELLGRWGDPTELIADRYLGLETAVRDADPRIRFYAARAIVEMDPRGPYKLAADVVNALTFTASARGRRNVLVVHPAPAQAEYLTGLLRGLRFDALSVANGREAVRFARNHPDLELILISELIKRPSWNEIAQRIALDYHSGSVPIVVLAREEKRPTVDGILSRFPQAGSFPTPAGRPEMMALLRDALPRAGQFALPSSQRLAYAASALQTLQPLVQNRTLYSFYEWDRYESPLVESITIPQLAVPAARVLGDLATPAAQSQLVDFASQLRQPATSRKAAAGAFAKAVERAGVLLNSQQIEQQYKRYNDNLDHGEETAAILSSLLDTIEKPSRK